MRSSTRPDGTRWRILRSLQDWHLRYALESVKGVGGSRAGLEGSSKQYQIDVDPNKLAAYGISINDVVDKMRKSNNDVGGKIFEIAVDRILCSRGRGYIKSIEDIENVPPEWLLRAPPVYVKKYLEQFT